MKKTTSILIFLMLGIFVLSGCSSTEQRIFPQRDEFQGVPDTMANISEEERQQLFEERQQQAIDSCQDKNEGDACIFESPRGETQGVCKNIDNNLVCTTDRVMRQR